MAAGLLAFFAAGLDTSLAATFLVVVFFFGCLVTAIVAVIVSPDGEMVISDTQVFAPGVVAASSGWTWR